MNYVQLTKDDALWLKFKDHITFNYKGSKPAEAAHYIKVPFKDALSLVNQR